jgi:hypothetical protein
MLTISYKSISFVFSTSKFLGFFYKTCFIRTVFLNIFIIEISFAKTKIIYSRLFFCRCFFSNIICYFRDFLKSFFLIFSGSEIRVSNTNNSG